MILPRPINQRRRFANCRSWTDFEADMSGPVRKFQKRYAWKQLKFPVFGDRQPRVTELTHLAPLLFSSRRNYCGYGRVEYISKVAAYVTITVHVLHDGHSFHPSIPLL